MLKVWLPLDGDLRNLGCSNVTITNNGATVNNSGKIGKCYSPATITITNINNLFFDNSSYCFWAKTNSTGSWQLAIGIDNSSNSQIHGIYVADSARFKLEYNPSLNVYNAEIGSWHHYAFIIKNGESRCYYDGVLATTSNEAVTNDVIGRLRLGVGTSIFLNDVRIYDHCLSAAEVHEIAMGLVLHYKLNSMKIKTGTNLVTGITAGGHTTKLTDGKIGVQTTGENADTYFTINLSESITNGTKYFLSCDASGISEGAYWGFPLGAQGNSTLPFKIYNGHNEYSFTANDISWGSNRLFMDDNSRADWANKATFWNFELYKAPALEVEDSSGYGHNGEIINASTFSTDTPRYNSCYHISATNQHIKISGLTTSGFGNSYSFSWWGKCSTFSNTMQWGFSDGVRLNGIYYGNLWNTGDSSQNPLYKPGTTTQVTAPSTGIWHHFVMTGNGTSCKVYLDGEYWGIAKTYKSISGTSIYINGWNSSTDYCNSDLYISDFRIYCTPLLDNDIKMLYNVGMRVDNLGGVHTFELNEYSNNKIASVQVVNNSATSFTFDKITNTYTITSPVGTSSWGYGLRFADTPADLIVPYGYSYRWSCDIFTPIAATFISDYNNTPISGSAWAGNDNDLTSQRLSYSIGIPANTWTTITLGSSNTHTSNTSHISIRDYSSMGMITNGMSEPLVWKIRNLKWYLVEKEPINSVNKKGQVISNFYNEDSVKKIASISNKNKSFSATEFIEI